MLKANRILRTQNLLIDELRRTNELLTAIPEQLAHSNGKIMIQNLKIEQASLDKLLFQLDHIDVKELSGTLNLGNNFQVDKPKNHSEKNAKPLLQKLIHSAPETSAETDRETDSNASHIPSVDQIGMKYQMVETSHGYAIELKQS